jgi:uncharacterized cupredoxin-like copper-binding protein
MNPTRTLLAFAATCLLGVAASACGSDDETTTSGAQTSSTTTEQTTDTTQTTDTGDTTETTPPPEKDEGTVIVLKGGEPDGGRKNISLKSGDEGKITVESDEEVEIHLHGYEIKKTAKPDEPAEFEFDADIPGIFTMEVENTGTEIAEIEVS